MVLLFASCGLLSFLLFCFEFCLFHSSHKKNDQKNGHSKNPKKQKCRKKDNNQFARLCSRIVFLIFGGGWAKKCRFLPKTLQKLWIQHILQNEKRGQNVKNVESKLGPRLRQNLVHVCCAT